MNAVLERERLRRAAPGRAAGRPGVSRGLVGWLGGATALVLVVGLVAVGGFPTGHPSPEDVVAPGARLAARAPVDDVHVLLTVEAGELVALVAYEDDKGWLAVDLEPVPAGTAAAWAATGGDGPVPALSTVYGRAPGAAVRVEWADGEASLVRTARDGAYVVARDGRFEVDRVEVLDDDGELVLEVTEL